MIDAPVRSGTGLLLSQEEIAELTRYSRPGEQLTELHRQGFYRARRDRFGQVVLERAHYDAVCGSPVTKGPTAAAPEPQLRPVTRRMR